MEFDLVYEDMEGFFTFQDMHIHVHTGQFSKIVLRAQHKLESNTSRNGEKIKI
jgi:hypothetical protein